MQVIAILSMGCRQTSGLRTHSSDARLWCNWRGTSRRVIDRINAEVVRILALPEIREKFTVLGMEPTASTAERFAAVIRSDAEKSGRIIKAAGVRAD